MNEQKALSKRQVIADLTKSPHGNLDAYAKIGLQAAQEDPAFFGHLVSWNALKGEVRDAKSALPVLAFLATPPSEPELVENALAHLALLDPRTLERALFYARPKLKASRHRTLVRLVERYLRNMEADPKFWDRRAVQHRKILKTLYARYHVKPDDRANAILFRRLFEKGSVYEAIRTLNIMPPLEAAGSILKYKIPFLIASGALGVRMKSEEVVLALINQMTSNELVTNTKRLHKLGVRTVPALRAAFDAALQKASSGRGRKATLKAGVAAEHVEREDEVLAAKLKQLQEAQIQKALTIDGNWLVLGDKSPSMADSITAASEVAAILSRAVKGDVYLVYFDNLPHVIDVKGKTHEEIKHAVRGIRPGGQGTSIGVGMQYAIERGWQLDGIAVVSDAQENVPPFFAERYKTYAAKFGAEPSVYLYRMKPSMHGYQDRDLAVSMRDAGVELLEFDLRGGIDYYSLPNVVQTMRAGRYSLLDEVMATPLLRLDDVLKRTTGQEVLRVHQGTVAAGGPALAGR